MRSPRWVTAAEIDDWAKSTGARSTLPDLVRRLVLATLERENLQSINFPAYGEVQRHSYDGITLSNIANTHVPQGSCVWELSCQGNPKGKADKDYTDRLKDLKGKDVSNVTYFAVTARDWPGAADWATLRTQEKFFKEVRAYDSSNLEQWLLDTPAVALWLAGLRRPVQGVSDVDGYWPQFDWNPRKAFARRHPTHKSPKNRKISLGLDRWQRQCPCFPRPIT